MATQKPISTISYNSLPFLKEKLDLWVKQHIIQCYMYIYHKGEDGDKDHIHLRIEPNKKLDPMDLSDSLREYVPDNPLPLGCRTWHPSKEEDWFLYAVHDKKYLDLKYGGGEKGEKLPYTIDDIVVSDYYDKEIAFIRAKAYLEHTSVNMLTKMQQGTSALSLVLQGENPYLVNALLKTLSTQDYERIAQELERTQCDLIKIVDAIHKANFEIVQEGDGYALVSGL